MEAIKSSRIFLLPSAIFDIMKVFVLFVFAFCVQSSKIRVYICLKIFNAMP